MNRGSCCFWKKCPRRAVGGIHGSAILNAAGSSILKYSSTYKALPNSRAGAYWLIFFGAMAAFCGSFPFYAYGLSKMKLSVAQPMFSVGSYVAVALVAFFFFKRPYSIHL
jgi:multidrug transporter EmrE-like cation transporter